MQSLKEQISALSKTLSKTPEWSARKAARDTHLQTTEYLSFRVADAALKALPEYVERSELRRRLREAKAEAEEDSDE